MMNRLVKIVQKIFESIIDPPKKSLDSHVFNANLTLTNNSRKQINNALQEFLNSVKIFPKVEGIVIVGSILSLQWTESSDIDIGIVIDYDKLIKSLQVNSRIAANKYLSTFLQRVNGKYFINDHPINIYINDINDQIFKLDVNIYNFITNKWTKKVDKITYDPDEIRIQKDIVRKCVMKINNVISSTTMDVIDYKMLKSEIVSSIGDHDQVLALCNRLHLIKKKLENDLVELETIAKRIKDARRDALDADFKNSGPAEIRYKLYERYNIFIAIKELVKILNMILLDN